MTEPTLHADADLHLPYTVLGSTLRPLGRALARLPPGGVLALTSDDP